MSVQLKPLHEQVMLITGASSGIGRVTAKHAAEAGAKVILVARNEAALNEVAEEIKGLGGEAIVAVADVADKDAFAAAAERGVAAYGRIDTWVNNAGTGMYADITQDNTADDKKLFETNFWGVVNGSRLAAQYLRDGGGALINVGSEVSDVVTPTQGMYAASKHAVLGFTDAFRLEVIKSELPISVTLIKPAGINTPFPQHAKNNIGQAGTLPAPVYAPELVADQILHAAEHPVRHLYVGGGGRLMVLLAEHFPTLSDWVIAKFMPSHEVKDEAPDYSGENLHGVGTGHADHGTIEEEGRQVRKHSLYGVLSRHPVAVTFSIAAASAVAAYLLFKPEEPEPTPREKFKAKVRGYTAGPLSRVRDAVSEYAAEPISRAKAAAQAYAAEAAERAKAAVQDYAVDPASRARKAAGDHAEDASDYLTEKAAAARRAAGEYVDTANDYVSDKASAAHGYASQSVDSVHEALQEHVVKPAEKLFAAAKKKIDALLNA